MTSLSTLSSTSGSQPIQLPQPEQNEVTVAKVMAAISDDNVIELILTYAGDPTLPLMNDKIYKFILQANCQNGVLARFFVDLTAIPQGSHEQVMMDLFDRVVNLVHEPTILPLAQAAYLKGAAPLALAPIMEIAAPVADRDLVSVFNRIAETVPEAEAFLESDEMAEIDDVTEKAAKIRLWMENNRPLLGAVTQLNLSYIDLASVPPELEEFFGGLQKLNLAANKLISVPDLRFPHLRELSLVNNELVSVPNFHFLPDLLEFHLEDNHLTTIPDFSHLGNLRELCIDNNHLTSVPNFSHIPFLLDLHLRGNQLQIVPDFRFLQLLEVLDLGENQMPTVPDFPLMNLVTLLLDRNLLQEVPDFNHFLQLERLSLEYNQLKTTPNFRIPSLQLLYLEFNQITETPDYCYLEGLLGLSLTNNQLIKAPELSNSAALNWVQLSDNQLSTVPNYQQPTLNLLSFENNPLTSLPVNLNELVERGCTVYQ